MEEEGFFFSLGRGGEEWVEEMESVVPWGQVGGRVGKVRVMRREGY